MGTKASTFQQIAVGLQGVVFVIVALVGGWWGLRTWNFEHPRFYEEGGEVAGVPLAGTMEAEQLSALPGPRMVSVRVVLSHKSHLTEILRLSQIPLLASRLDDQGNEYPVSVYAEIIGKDGKRSRRDSVAVPPGEEVSVVFAFSPQQPGTYLLQFDPCTGGKVEPCIIQKYAAVR